MVVVVVVVMVAALIVVQVEWMKIEMAMSS